MRKGLLKTSSLKMNILADYHHSGLFNSLQLLFEKRLGHKLYRQTGMKWYEKGYWNIYPNIDTVRQYLEEREIPKDGTPPLNDPIEPYEYNDYHHHSINKGLTWGMFKTMPIDIVIASIPQHVAPFKKLAEMKNAKFIFQMGNVFEMNLHDVPNLMANTLPKSIPASTHYISYHQEISPVFKPSDLPVERLITSFINVYHNNKGFEDFMALKSAMPSHEFRSYGGQCVDGVITGEDNMAAIMNKSQFGFHVKHGGDGFGHVLYDWFATGKPIITRISDYKGKLGEELLKDGSTCIDLDTWTIQQVSDIIMNMPPLRYIMMCQNVRDRFEKYVNYDKEEVSIRKFLEELK